FWYLGRSNIQAYEFHCLWGHEITPKPQATTDIALYSNSLLSLCLTQICHSRSTIIENTLKLFGLNNARVVIKGNNKHLGS
uniref:Uncharacterized protein n=1 Tax=Xiphophorus couchianus TaxID=32473 RepID=A0A3B5LCJ5_9TELE